MTPPRDCPCRSGARYKACCGPIHGGARAATPEALMRSRFSAFALGLGDYLVDTLAREHADRALPREALARELAQIRDRRRFMGLEIRESRESGDEGWVTFHARVFEKGKDVSFAERSRFVREDGAWRYASGEIEEG
ncbi:MAG: hypothetical protein KF819_23225 [Labilithrix sp.]|nr:hypothetical protein [Labilithrix sp.]